MRRIKKNVWFLILVFAGCIALLEYLNPGVPLTHDGKDHLARIANFYVSLSEGNIVPRWGANLNWGFGHPVLMFLYPLSSYLASFFLFLQFSVEDSFKLVMGTTFLASGITMYLWLKELLGEKAGVIGGILYMFAPYRFVDIYVRGAIGEHVAFVFPPLIAFLLLRLFRQKKSTFPSSFPYFFLIAISSAGLILAHNAISLMFFPFLFLYGLYLWFFEKKDTKKLVVGLVGVGYGFLLSAFFWIPAFLEGKYTLRDIVTGGSEYADRFIDPTGLLWGSWNYGITGEFSIQIGIVHLILTILFAVLLFRFKKNIRIFSLGILLYFILSIFIMTSYSNPFWEFVTTLQKFQFPWRFLSVVVFTTSVMGALVVSVIKNNVIQSIVASVLILFVILFYGSFYQAKGFLQNNNSFYFDTYHGTTDTGESAPIWSVRFMEKKPPDTIEVVEGEVEIEKGIRTSIRHNYTVVVESEKARLKDNTVYFPGWKVLVDGGEVDIQFQDPAHRGLITFFVPRGEHEVEVVFRDTRVRMFSNVISSFSILIIVMGGVSLALFGKK